MSSGVTSLHCGPSVALRCVFPFAVHKYCLNVARVGLVHVLTCAHLDASCVGSASVTPRMSNTDLSNTLASPWSNALRSHALAICAASVPMHLPSISLSQCMMQGSVSLHCAVMYSCR